MSYSDLMFFHKRDNKELLSAFARGTIAHWFIESLLNLHVDTIRRNTPIQAPYIQITNDKFGRSVSAAWAPDDASRVYTLLLTAHSGRLSVRKLGGGADFNTEIYVVQNGMLNLGQSYITHYLKPAEISGTPEQVEKRVRDEEEVVKHLPIDMLLHLLYMLNNRSKRFEEPKVKIQRIEEKYPSDGPKNVNGYIIR